ncbi:bifunctional phosphopantothenoylcysteine decarboxylase/phosphopantothenate--cysteine ligase CoaBC [Celerinatantimonas diazotrophica]|uniref:Coenzyme A biosynthesis bifunctional protein CoaBC n=1 Tax=Celerinatantimonas diazotrophica TaxID=412034 RepID=A0A4R1J7C6_9GAMM|nr:bifunctional phosphopantothenoylcysteine decarboxylase/phosphopantothenate--cysteine ligase CoaBC [Celerinatantimonas diazotrophica]TCK46380.1 phosphopantothenoylcysteine decarboxylase/phosphopantothenate--cysteine ligase [Celerinatantimonas diazotrophica]CAG9295246.1 Coenzyme A biosynthesis bifunctional protein CoaBC [Celerinatantimonas diazotrophica]
MAELPVLEGKQILIAGSGGIAAYKLPELVRAFVKQGASVRVALTEHASHFVSPMALQAVSGYPVAQALMDPHAELSMSHIELAKWADVVLVAPATANCIAKLAHGIADDLVSTLLLATPSPIAIAPAMNQQMYRAAATTENLAILKKRGVWQLGPAAGEQACGDVGPGRMLQPEELVLGVIEHLKPQSTPLTGKRVTITAGPTQEAIDPVRYISNYSSGKMGYALARAARNAGADVTLISGPVSLATPQGCQRIDVKSARQMHQTALEVATRSDIFIACAAVADYRVGDIAEQKIKKSNEQMQLTLVRNPDIVAAVASLAQRPFVVGFAAETQDVARYAKDKMQRKHLDMIAANNVASPDSGFNVDENALQVFWADGEKTLPRASKQQLADQLIKLITTQYQHETN